MPEKVSQQTYWDENLDPENLGGEFDPRRFRLEEEMAFYFTPDQEEGLREMAPPQGKRVLEVGAGVGVNTLHLAQSGATVVAIDIAHERLLMLRQLAQQTLHEGAAKVYFVKCSAEALPFREEMFDHVYSKAVMIHTRLGESLPEARRVLRPGASAVFIEPLTRNPLVNLYRNTLAPKIWKQITRYFGPEELGIVRQHFPQMQYKSYYLFSFLAFFWQFGVRAPRLFRLSLALTHALDRLLFALLPPLRRYAWFATIKAKKPR